MAWDTAQYHREFAIAQYEDPELKRIILILEGKVSQDDLDTPEYKVAMRHAKYMALGNNGVLECVVLCTLQDPRANGDTVVAQLDVPRQIVVPVSRQQEIMRMHHNDQLAAHAGMTAMVKAMTGRFYWYRMARDVRAFVANCRTCQSRKPPQPKWQGLLHPYDFSSAQPLDDIAIDHIGPFPVSIVGHKYVLVIMDIFTRWVELVPVPDTKASTTAEAIWRYWICRWGVFKRYAF